jgi:hypothetical protein
MKEEKKVFKVMLEELEFPDRYDDTALERVESEYNFENVEFGKEFDKATPEQKERIKRMFDEYGPYIMTGKVDGLSTKIKEKFPIETNGLVCLEPSRLSPKKMKIVDDEIDKMLAQNLIRRCSSEWASPIVLVPKPNGKDGEILWRYGRSLLLAELDLREQ